MEDQRQNKKKEAERREEEKGERRAGGLQEPLGSSCMARQILLTSKRGSSSELTATPRGNSQVITEAPQQGSGRQMSQYYLLISQFGVIGQGAAHPWGLGLGDWILGSSSCWWCDLGLVADILQASVSHPRRGCRPPPLPASILLGAGGGSEEPSAVNEGPVRHTANSGCLEAPTLCTFHPQGL